MKKAVWIALFILGLVLAGLLGFAAWIARARGYKTWFVFKELSLGRGLTNAPDLNTPAQDTKGGTSGSY